MADNSIKPTQLGEQLITYLKRELKNPKIKYRLPPTRLHGGYETVIYRFQLQNVAERFTQPLVLRLYPPIYGPENARWESTVQEILAKQGLPVPRTYTICLDDKILGGPFFIMDFLPGKPLMMEDPDIVPNLLGHTHAALHEMNPTPVVRALTDEGIHSDRYTQSGHYDWLYARATHLPWINAAAGWLKDNLPPAPERQAICHGDFHALNILVDEGRVSGILDWPGFTVADPVFDVANTLVLTTIPAKHLTDNFKGFSSINWNHAGDLYLAAYQSQNPIDLTHVDYYKVRRCILALIQGFEGQKIWQHSDIVADLVGFIYQITGIKVTPPG